MQQRPHADTATRKIGTRISCSPAGKNAHAAHTLQAVRDTPQERSFSSPWLKSNAPAFRAHRAPKTRKHTHTKKQTHACDQLHRDLSTHINTNNHHTTHSCIGKLIPCTSSEANNTCSESDGAENVHATNRPGHSR